MAQPTDDLVIWANTDVNLPKLAGPNKTKPIDDLINKGWDFTEKPTADEFNYILNNMGKWINWAITDIEAGTSLNTPNTLVRRDGSGNFSAGNITASLLGNASTSSKWQTARNFALTGAVTGNVNFDGSGNIELSTFISSAGISILTGTISHGGTIPLPSGYSEGQCRWMVSMNKDNASNIVWDIAEDGTGLHYKQQVYTTGRVVTAQTYLGSNNSLPGWISSIANYIIIGVK